MNALIALLMSFAIVAPLALFALTGRPPRGLTARDRLIQRNPMLNDGGLRWSVNARRVRTRWSVALAVTLALFVAGCRPLNATENG
jgi:hypothetical protein